MPLLKNLETLDIFQDLTDDELAEIQKLCREEEYQRNDKLFTEGDPADDLWIIIEGKVDLRFEMPNAKPVTEESTVSSHDHVIPEAQVFGWSSFIPPYKMRLSAYCVTRKCRALKIDRESLSQLMERNTSIGYKIMKYTVKVVGFRFKQFQDEVVKFMGMNMMNSW
ncbi:MAG: cyclic nucleotide-binding domain-containing protein [Desulfobacteraceae bacterium]